MKYFALATAALVGVATVSVATAPASAHGWRNKQVCKMVHRHRVCHNERQRW